MVTIDEQVLAYEASRARIDELVRDLDEGQLKTTVPCCPAWSVKDLVGHVTGVLEDRASGRLPTQGTFEAWTDEQVVRHRDQPIAQVLDTWRELPVLPNQDAPTMASLSYDAVTHEHDLLGALGVAGDRSTDSVRVGAARATERMGSILADSQAPGVLLETEDGERELAGGAAPIGLTTTRYWLMRLVAGRVSRPQAGQLGWDGDPSPVLAALFADGFFTLQPVDVPR